MAQTRYTLEVQPVIPPRLRRLAELANDLLYSWDRQVRGLFFRLDTELWEACGHNPKLFLRRVAQDRLERAAEDRIFMEEYNRVLSAYDTYHSAEIKTDVQELFDPREDLVAYFCAEFGFHESMQIYSGGLGILAGDHCKAASDLGIPFVAVGMLYRQGYFIQTIDGHGNQITHYTPTNFADLPITPAVADGGEVHVHVGLPGRRVVLKVWKAKAGRVTLYLLDSDLPENTEADRRITYQLYGGDSQTRIQQEMVLGIGGVRALRALGLTPTVWHINEGHAAFLIPERCRELVHEGLDFDSALEAVAANTVFTTHTSVAAGHDIFDPKMMQAYFAEFAAEAGVGLEHFLSLGSNPTNHGGFDMTALALRGSRFRNGVSRIHGAVTARLAAYIWPQIPPEENPVGYITNGVHVPTFLAREWVNQFDMRLGGGWRNELLNGAFWAQHIEAIPDHGFWSLRQSLKSEMLTEVRQRVIFQLRRNGASEALIDRLTAHLSPAETDILTIGFARRFATYKRATLLFSDPTRLARLLSDAQRPALVIFAGKAHPHDLPAQQFIKTIHDFSRRPEFEGRIILLEGYDQALARKLVTGVDVWLNTPEYPLEASGTSGEKAGINGVVNLSVLDGWWGEGYNGENGWAITPHGPQFDPAYRDREEAQELLDILERQVIPLYYQRDGQGYPPGWVKKSKASMKSLIPRFNAQRMVMDYIRDYYSPARKHRLVMTGNQYARAREVAAWRKKLTQAWPKVRVRRLDEPAAEITAGSALPIRIALHLNGLQPDDVLVECLVGTESESGEFLVRDRHVFTLEKPGEDGDALYRLDLRPRLAGLQHYKIRVYPFHHCLSHRFEAGYMIWL